MSCICAHWHNVRHWKTLFSSPFLFFCLYHFIEQKEDQFLNMAIFRPAKPGLRHTTANNNWIPKIFYIRTFVTGGDYLSGIIECRAVELCVEPRGATGLFWLTPWGDRQWTNTFFLWIYIFFLNIFYYSWPRARRSMANGVLKNCRIRRNECWQNIERTAYRDRNIWQFLWDKFISVIKWERWHDNRRENGPENNRQSQFSPNSRPGASSEKPTMRMMN